MGGTLCKDCPFKDIKGKEDCMTLFARKYFNSCTNLNIKEVKTNC